MKLSLDQMLAIHRAEGKRPLLWLPKDGGEFEVECVDAISGRRIWKEVHHNLMTYQLHNSMVRGSIMGSNLGYAFVSNDEKPMNVRKNVLRATYSSSPSVPMHVLCSAFTKNVPSRTWTFTGTILAPASGHVRYYRTVGICADAATSGTNCYAVFSVIAATLLSEMKTQTDVQLININYRLAWEEGHNV